MASILIHCELLLIILATIKSQLCSFLPCVWWSKRNEMNETQKQREKERKYKHNEKH